MQLIIHRGTKEIGGSCVELKTANNRILIDFNITPFLVDHSAFDAFAFLIEAEGKRLFYSGDFRAHGRKAILFKQIIERPPQNIDCLLMEGSALGREDAQYKTEEEVEKRFEEILRERKNIT